MATDTGDQAREQLLKALEITNISYDTLQIIILAIVLSAVNVNKIKVQLQDQLNNTNYAECLPDTSNLPLITSIMIVYGTYIFAQVGQQTLQDQKQISTEPNDPALTAASDGYLASVFVFIAALIRLNNVINKPKKETVSAEVDDVEDSTIL